MLTLEKYTAADYPLCAQLFFNEQVMKMNLGRVFTDEEAKMFFDAIISYNASNTGMGFYKVLLPPKGQDRERCASMDASLQDEAAAYIGMGALSWNDEYSAVEIEYMLLPTYWNHGYGTKLVEMLLELAHASHQAADIIAITDPSNTYSQRILQNKGFTLEKQYINDEGESAALYTRKPPHA